MDGIGQMASALRRFVVEDGQSKAGLWAKRAGAVEVEWPVLPFDPFFNVNTAEDAATASRALPSRPAGLSLEEI